MTGDDVVSVLDEVVRFWGASQVGCAEINAANQIAVTVTLADGR